jgi:hypothetical protein
MSISQTGRLAAISSYRILFERLGIHVEPVYVNTSVGLEKLAAGEFAAILHTVAKPNDFLRNVKPESGIHFIEVDAS